MGILLSLIASAACTLLQFIATLNFSAASWVFIYQPKAPKSLLK